MHTFARHSSYGGLAASWQKTSIKIPGSSELPAGVPPPPASEWDWKKPDWELLKVPGWEVTYRNKPKACKAAADAAGSGARPPGSLVDAHIGRQHKHNNGEKYRYRLQGPKTWVRRYRLFKKSLRKRNLWPKMSSKEVAAYVAVAVAAAGAIVHVLRGRRGKKVDDKYP